MNKTTEALKLAEEALDLAQALLEKSCHHATILNAYKETRKYREALAEQEKQEPVAEFEVGIGENGEAKFDSFRFMLPKHFPAGQYKLYAAPVSAKAIRAEDYIKAYQQGRKDMKEEAAKVCDSRADGALQAAEFAGRNALIAAEEATECATAIRKLK